MIEILRITSAFGIQGAVNALLYTDNIHQYKKLFDASGREFGFRVLHQASPSKATLLLDGIRDRTTAEKLRNTSLYIDRDSVPALEENQFYICDLIGQDIPVVDKDISLKIIDVQNFGAGDLLELQSAKNSFYVPFTKENFPDIDGTMCLSQTAYENFKD